MRDAGWDPEQVSATFVGGHASGWPLDQPLDRSWSGIRGGDSPDDHPINDIHFVKKDPKGKQIPSFAHIRKANTRDMPIGRERRAEAQTHRLLRRGLPYGPPFVEGAPQGSPGQADPAFPNDRGLLFLCYQRSIQNQFEYVQKGLNDPNFPTDGAGVDPIAGQQKSSGSKLKLSNTFQVTVQPWVTVTGGDYFFAPSISALRTLSNREGR